MMHSTGRGLAFFILMGVPLLFGEAGRGQQEEPAPFEIRLPPEIRSEQVQVRYFLTGPFGGQGSFLTAEPERNVYLIGTSVNHQAAKTLKVILYAPGCQIVTIVVPSLSESEKGADVSCEDLPPMTFNGRVELPETFRSRHYEVEITYMAYWAHEFFGIEDGAVTTFHLGRVTPDEGGAFQVLLPNFTRDAVTESFHRNAGLQFIAREHDTGNIVSFLVPANEEWKNLRDLPLKPKYHTPVVFKPLPESAQNQTAGPTRKEVH
jgi:hypothetical protein